MELQYRRKDMEAEDDYQAWAESLGIKKGALMDALRTVGREKVILFMGPPPAREPSQLPRDRRPPENRSP